MTDIIGKPTKQEYTSMWQLVGQFARLCGELGKNIPKAMLNKNALDAAVQELRANGAITEAKAGLFKQLYDWGLMHAWNAAFTVIGGIPASIGTTLDPDGIASVVQLSLNGAGELGEAFGSGAQQTMGIRSQNAQTMLTAIQNQPLPISDPENPSPLQAEVLRLENTLESAPRWIKAATYFSLVAKGMGAVGDFVGVYASTSKAIAMANNGRNGVAVLYGANAVFSGATGMAVAAEVAIALNVGGLIDPSLVPKLKAGAGFAAAAFQIAASALQITASSLDFAAGKTAEEKWLESFDQLYPGERDTLNGQSSASRKPVNSPTVPPAQVEG